RLELDGCAIKLNALFVAPIQDEKTRGDRVRLAVTWILLQDAADPGRVHLVAEQIDSSVDSHSIQGIRRDRESLVGLFGCVVRIIILESQACQQHVRLAKLGINSM